MAIQLGPLVRLAEAELGSPVLALAFFKPAAPPDDLGRWPVSLVIVEDIEWLMNHHATHMSMHTVLVVTESELAAMDFSYGSTITLHHVFGRWPRSQVTVEEADPFHVTFTVPGRPSVRLEALEPGPDARRVIDLLVGTSG